MILFSWTTLLIILRTSHIESLKVFSPLTHWGRVMGKCVGKLTIIGSDNGLLPGRRHAIIWINAGILFIGPLGTNFSEIYIKIITFSFKKMHLKMSSAKWQPYFLGPNVLKTWCYSSFPNCVDWVLPCSQCVWLQFDATSNVWPSLSNNLDKHGPSHW